MSVSGTFRRQGRRLWASTSLFKSETWEMGMGKMVPSHLCKPYVTSFFFLLQQPELLKQISLPNHVLFRLILKSVHIPLSHINRWLDTRCWSKSSLGFKHLPQIVLRLPHPPASAWPPGKVGTYTGSCPLSALLFCRGVQPHSSLLTPDTPSVMPRVTLLSLFLNSKDTCDSLMPEALEKLWSAISVHSTHPLSSHSQVGSRLSPSQFQDNPAVGPPTCPQISPRASGLFPGPPRRRYPAHSLPVLAQKAWSPGTVVQPLGAWHFKAWIFFPLVPTLTLDNSQADGIKTVVSSFPSLPTTSVLLSIF